MIELTLPVAPTANNAFLNRRSGRGYGRVKAPKYRRWIAQADKCYVIQGLGRKPPIIGPYSCEMLFPDMAQGDLDGRLKLILDWLVSRKIVQSDAPRFLRGLNVKFGTTQDDVVQITLRSADGRPQHDAAQAPAR